LEVDQLKWMFGLALAVAGVGWIVAAAWWRRAARLELERDAALARVVDAAELDRRIGPIDAALRRTHEELGRIGRTGAGLRAQIKGVLNANKELSRETSRLSRALRRPNVRGRYGEIQLERVVELAGMRPYCDFGTQVSVDVGETWEGRSLRPDLVVRLPNDRVIVVDAKTSLDSFLDAVEADSPARAKAHRERFAASVAEQIDRLSRKEYWAQFERSPEFVVMFIPGDQFIDMALRARPGLIERAAERDVILASPSTLIGLLRAVHVGWREQRLSDSAQELFELGRELHARSATVFAHADALGASLRGAVERYNACVGSMEERMLPTLRRFEESGADSAKELVAPRPVEPVLRPVRATRKRRRRQRGHDAEALG
jgi:DNA recombination protein RmuC